jgi:YjbE family integral membrane protein
LDTEILTSIFSIIVIDIILGGDNAIVIALACRNLPGHQKNQAIILGTGLAITARVLLTIVVVYLLQIPFVMLIGGLLLTIIAYKLLVNNYENESVKPESTLFGAVKTIVFADLIMGLDNVLGIAGAADGNILLVVIGLLFSVPIIIWGSKLILHLMEHFPVLIYIGSGVLSYTAGKMIISEERLRGYFITNPKLEIMLILFIILGVILVGWVKNHFHKVTFEK